MAGTYSQLHAHAIFAVKNRQCVIDDSWKDELYKFIFGVIREKNQFPLIVNGMPDHIHMLFGFRPAVSLAEIIRDVKCNSSRFINQKNFVQGEFAWQEGYGVFSLGKGRIDWVYNYIANQEQHHKKMTFQDEYRNLLEREGIAFNNKYLFAPV